MDFATDLEQQQAVKVSFTCHKKVPRYFGTESQEVVVLQSQDVASHDNSKDTVSQGKSLGNLDDRHLAWFDNDLYF
jgi:hypothetical protein